MGSRSLLYVMSILFSYQTARWGIGIKKLANYSHRTATTKRPCCIPTLGDSMGAGRVRLASGAKVIQNSFFQRRHIHNFVRYVPVLFFYTHTNSPMFGQVVVVAIAHRFHPTQSKTFVAHHKPTFFKHFGAHVLPF